MINKDFVAVRDIQLYSTTDPLGRPVPSSYEIGGHVFELPKPDFYRKGTLKAGQVVHVNTANFSYNSAGVRSLIYNTNRGIIKGQSDVDNLKPSDAKSDTRSQTKNANMKYLYLAVIGVVGVLAYKKFKK